MPDPVRPLFPFYGSKWRDARRYPAPDDGLVIEPFASIKSTRGRSSEVIYTQGIDPETLFEAVA